MQKRKKIRNRGKIKFSEYFKELKEGEHVAVVKELALQASFPKQLQGKTGVVECKRGKEYIVKIKDGRMEKRYIIAPIHLKKIK